MFGTVALHANRASLAAQRAVAAGGLCLAEAAPPGGGGLREGQRPHDLAGSVHTTYAGLPAHPPSRRTLERWAAQRRWLTARPPPPP